jgi:hypothetical protein
MPASIAEPIHHTASSADPRTMGTHYHFSSPPAPPVPVPFEMMPASAASLFNAPIGVIGFTQVERSLDVASRFVLQFAVAIQLIDRRALSLGQ